MATQAQLRALRKARAAKKKKNPMRRYKKRRVKKKCKCRK